jgi:septal ring factor EnvC (AmiA/AmiB activator)
MKKAILFFVLIISITLCHAQDDKASMERERQDIQREISDLQKAYGQLKGQKKATLGQAAVLRRKIELQERYLNNINREIRYINDDIYSSTLQINKLQKELDTLKAQYARSVVYAYKNRSTYDYLNFIFSAGSFNDAMKRIEYLKSYRSYREQQVNSMKEKQVELGQRKKDQLAKKQEKNAALQNQSKQVVELEVQKKENDVVVKELKSKEGDLKKELASKQRRLRQLSSQIDALIARKMKEAKDEADRLAKEKARNTPTVSVTPTPNVTSTTRNKPVAKKDESFPLLNDKDIALNTNFIKNKGLLPWPVDNGYVSAHFGTNKDEVTHLVFDNPGITINTQSAGAPVKAVFAGVVTSVFNLGDAMAVMIQHGTYFTIYSNLSSANVSKGQSINIGEVIGKVAADEDGSGGKLDFILMKEKQKVNPSLWLRK